MIVERRHYEQGRWTPPAWEPVREDRPGWPLQLRPVLRVVAREANKAAPVRLARTK